MGSSTLDNATPREALQRLRVLWFALLLGQVIFFCTIVFIMPPLNGAGEVLSLLYYISLAALAPVAVFGHIVRSQIYKRHWREHAVTPAGYVGGNLVYLALWEGVSLLSLMTVMLSSTIWPYILPSAVAVVVQLINWPTGAPMQPREPEVWMR